MKTDRKLFTILNQLTKILKMEEVHVDGAEMQQAQIKQSGIENYLTNQADGGIS